MIFASYTGNAMLNNALMTIEALAGLKSVRDITPSSLLKLYQRQDLKSLNTRLKSYTMLFTKNGPLHNDAKNGATVYDALMQKLLINPEVEGDKVCEISGLKFKTTFTDRFIEVLKSIGLSDKEIKKKDTTLNRNWFPLIGGLGSDAQALPQAKFVIQIHPVCIAIMQFLPLSALLYKGGILLIDSSNFEFSRRFVAQNTKDVQKRIEVTPVEESIENIRDFSKGNYLLKAIGILEDKELDETYSDLNLWSFSNSGTGANCEIDRVPNSLLKKLISLRKDITIAPELIRILTDQGSSYRFLEHLENNTEWPGLYPAVFGSGKKKVEQTGVSVKFLEAYFKEIDSQQKTAYARYLAYLIRKYKTFSFDKYLSKTDAWSEKEYKNDLYAVLIAATRNGEWDLNHHFEILDLPDQLPIRNFYYGIHRLTHFYFLKETFNSQMPQRSAKESCIANLCKWIISLIEQDEKRDSYFVRSFADNQNYTSINYNELLIRSARYSTINLEKILATFFDEELKTSWYSINELLRIFYNQKDQQKYELADFNIPSIWIKDERFLDWESQLLEFVSNYQAYYMNKYSNRVTGRKPFSKLLSQISNVPNNNGHFIHWLNDAVENVNSYLKDRNGLLDDKWKYDDLIYNPLGETSVPFSRFAIKFLMHKYYYQIIINQSETITITP